MGMSLSNDVFFGIDLGCPEEDEMPFVPLDEDGNFDPYELEGSVEKMFPELTIKSSNYYDYQYLFLAFKDKSMTGFDLNPVDLDEVVEFWSNERKKRAIETLKQACDKFNIPFKEPRLYASASYF